MQVYDLKGSTVDRTVLRPGQARSPGVVMKDNDLDRPLSLLPPLGLLLRRQLQRDVAWLRAKEIMDYSLLVGMSFLPCQHSTTTAPQEKKTEGPSSGGGEEEAVGEEQVRFSFAHAP